MFGSPRNTAHPQPVHRKVDHLRAQAGSHIARAQLSKGGVVPPYLAQMPKRSPAGGPIHATVTLARQYPRRSFHTGLSLVLLAP